MYIYYIASRIFLEISVIWKRAIAEAPEPGILPDVPFLGDNSASQGFSHSVSMATHVYCRQEELSPGNLAKPLPCCVKPLDLTWYTHS